MTVALYEDFNHPAGEFDDYDTYDTDQLIALGGQRHVDIRSFESQIGIGFAMYDLDTMGISDIEGMTMLALESEHIIQPSEGWTSGTVGPQSDYHNLSGISLTCPIGVTSTTSFIETAVNEFTVNLVTGDLIVVTLPAFPLPDLDLNNTFLDITSGDFTHGPTVSLSFGSSVTPLLIGDTEATFPVSGLEGININAITGVRFRVTATTSCTFRCLAIRCFAASWDFGPIDKNTLYDRLQFTVPRFSSGANATLPGLIRYPEPTLYPSHGGVSTITFPTSGLTPSDWPILFFSDPSDLDPAPVDLEVGSIIHTGSGLVTNTFSLYMREAPLLKNTQDDLDDMNMLALAELEEQPDTAISPGAQAPLSMYGLDGQLTSMLDDDTMGFLETAVRVTTRYIRMSIQWGVINLLSIENELGEGYSFPIAVNPASDYYLLTTLEDHSLRVQIYPLTPQGFIEWDSPVFDSTAVIDQSFVYRRPGRFGWYAQLNEGDTYIKHIRPRYVTYKEYRSLPLHTETPTEGAQLFPSASPDINLYDGAIATPGATLSLDVTKSSSGDCLKVMCSGNRPLEGLTSAPIQFENLQESYVSFDLLAPVGIRLSALLIGSFRYILLRDISIQNTSWQHITIPLEEAGLLNQPGEYQFFLVQSTAIQSIWFVDNLVIPTRSVAWAGRQAADPWMMRDPEWIPFETTTNQTNGGILFDRGKGLQVRGRGLRQNSQIHSLKVLPKYAQLGNFVWDDEIPASAGPPVAHFGLTSSGDTISGDARTSTAPNGIAAYSWSFGDGTYAYGAQVTHTYGVAGTYTVTLTVIDLLGLANSTAELTSDITLGHVSLPLVFTT